MDSRKLPDFKKRANLKQMNYMKIEGERRLHGDVYISGSKNASLAIIPCALMSNEPISLNNIPIINDVANFLNLLYEMNVTVEINSNEYNSSKCLSLVINCQKAMNLQAQKDCSKKFRASIYLLSVLLVRFGRCRIPIPGGCCFGEQRPIDMHIEVLKQMGAIIELTDGYIDAYLPNSKSKFTGTRYVFGKKSVGATVNAILAATLAIGDTYLENCAREPEIIDLCRCLNQMGALIVYDSLIHGNDTDYIQIHDCKKTWLNGCRYVVMPDRIECATFMIAAAITEGELTINGIEYFLVKNIADKLIEANVEIIQTNEKQFTVRNKCLKNLKPISLTTSPHPFPIPTDVQPLFISLLCFINGTSLVTENVFGARFSVVDELLKMGACIKQTGNNSVKIEGVQRLHGNEVHGTDLRACAALILASLASRGTSRVYGIDHLERGYQMFAEKLRNCGAIIDVENV